jgi:pyruvate ferredoxin oxidoreductase gamma subunit/phenylglyoxylate dehydrogenase gamma subunit
MGTVKAGEILVHANVAEGRFGVSMPFFGFERQGAPVTSFVRLDDNKIRPKNKVYHPHAVLVLDPSLLVSANVFEGLCDDAVFVLNTKSTEPKKFIRSGKVKTAAWLDATALALELLGRPVTNTVILGAFIRATGWVGKEQMELKVAEFFGEKNAAAFRAGYDNVVIASL